MSSSERLTLYGLLLLGLSWLLGCQAMMAPITEAGRIPPGHARATIQVQLPTAKGMGGFATQATNDLRNLTLPARMRLTVTGLDIDTPIEPSGSHQNPIPLATTQASVAMIVPLGRNLIITAEGLTLDGQTIASSVVKGVFNALVDQGTTVAVANRLTTPVAEAMETILAKQSLGPDEQRRSRNLLLSFDAAALQLFVQQTLLGATGNMQTDLQRLANGQMLKHPGLVNPAALGRYVWERAAVPPNATFLTDGGGAFVSSGRVKGVITGVRPGVPVTILVDDPVSKPVTVEGSQSFTISSVRPGNWRVHAVANGYKATITHFSGTSTAPAFYAGASVAANGEAIDQDFTMAPLPAAVAAVTPGRGPASPSLTNPAFVTIEGQDFGDQQDGSVLVFQDQSSGATVAANQIDAWSNTRIRVAVPTLAGGNYRVRIDRPTINPGQFVTGTTQAVYGAGSWGRLHANLELPNAFGAQHLWVGSALNDDLHVRGMTLVGWDAILRGYQPTMINLTTGGVVPDVAFSDQGTATMPGTATAVHPDGRTVYIWSTGSALMTRTFGTSGNPLGAATALVPSSESDQTGIHPEAAAFDETGVLHIAYLAKSPDVLRPVYRRYRINGLGVPTALTPPLRIDTATAGTQDPPRLRLGRGGHVAVTWVDRRTGVAAHYLRPVKPDGTLGSDEIIRTHPILDVAVDSQGGMALCSYGPGEQKLARYTAAGALAGERQEGGWDDNRWWHGLQRLVFDHDDHLIGGFVQAQTYWDTRYSQYWTTWNVLLKGYVADQTGFVNDSWRPQTGIGGGYPVVNFNHANPVFWPMTVGPDGTVRFVYKDYFTGRAYVAQAGWF